MLLQRDSIQYNKCKHITGTLITDLKELGSVALTLIISNCIDKGPLLPLCVFLSTLQFILFYETQFSGIELQETYSFLQNYCSPGSIPLTSLCT